MSNRLASETSPYLLQHKDNPVDWYPWGSAAFAEAKAKNKPVFVSIGYAACHWCHVMAHESFENPEVGALMNELFINVKVDREERPDVDAVYMGAIHVMGESGGWPLSAFCDSDGKPYFLGTYFPPNDRYGRPGFVEVLRTMSEVFHDKRDQMANNAEALVDGLVRMDEHFRRRAIGGDVSRLDEGVIVAAARALAERSDPVNGGLGSAPKFPSSSVQELWGRGGRLKFGDVSLSAFLLQAERMARGGIYDHLGGGFSRYSVDGAWLVPHFEKMLYDNGQLLAVYADAFALTGNQRYAEVIVETVAWLRREMLDDGGGLYASQDADSEGAEGKYYVWTPEEIANVLGPADAIQFNHAYGVQVGGNFEGGKTVLSRVSEPGSPYEEAALADMRERLRRARSQRTMPATDSKILAGWNALAVVGLIRAWETTGQPLARDLALQVACFLREQMLFDDGDRVWRVHGKKDLEGTLDDYSFVAFAFLRTAEATGEASWWQLAIGLLHSVIDRFYESRDGVGIFYMTPHGSDDALIYRPESFQDGAMPAGASLAVQGLIRIGLISGDSRALAVAENYLAGRAPQAAEQPFMGARLLGALDDYLNSVQLVVTPGVGREELLRSARALYAPTLAVVGDWASASFWQGRSFDGDQSSAYVCRGQSCSLPVTTSAELSALIKNSPG